MRRHILLAILVITTGRHLAAGQQPVAHLLYPLTGEAPLKTNLRGLSSLDGKSIWVSGSQGLIGYSKDEGMTWSWHRPAGYTARDFRDIEDLGDGKAVAIAIDTPAVIIRTTDGGLSWQSVYYNDQPGMFLDAVDFAGPRNGLVVGDPVHGQVFLAGTSDGGMHWQPVSGNFKDSIVAEEAFFAASGSNVRLDTSGNFILASGGGKSRLWRPNEAAQSLPFRQGNATSGPNGMDKQGKTIAIVGGDYTQPSIGDSCFALSYDKGRHWEPYHRLPGYGSSVAIINQQRLIACGLKGVWMTQNGGRSWQTIDARPFNALLYLPKSNKILLAGPEGHIAVLEGF